MQALNGIRVVDFTRVVAGPYCTYQLALMGADVIKIEEVGRGDPVRHSGAGTDSYFWDRGMATNFLPQNANKRSMTLDLKTEAGRAVAVELAKRADVLTLGANEEHQYQRLCRALGLANLLSDSRFTEIRERRRNRDLLHEEFRRVLATRTADEWEGILNDAGVPAAKIRSVAEILQHPQVTERGVLHTFHDVPGLDRDVTVLLSPFRLAHDGPRATTPPPRIGADTDAILGELGYGSADIGRLRQDKVI